MKWEYKLVIVLLEVLFLSNIVIVAAVNTPPLMTTAQDSVGGRKCGEGGPCPIEYTNVTQNITQEATKNATAATNATQTSPNQTIKAVEAPVYTVATQPPVVQAKNIPASTPKPTTYPTVTPQPTPTPQKVQILYFYQNNCPACVQMEPIMKQVAANPKYFVTYINLTNDQWVGKNYGVTVTPTVIAGTSHLVGVVSYEQIINAAGW